MVEAEPAASYGKKRNLSGERGDPHGEHVDPHGEVRTRNSGVNDPGHSAAMPQALESLLLRPENLQPVERLQLDFRPEFAGNRR